MAFTELAKKRFSSRKYTDKPVEREIIIKILETVRLAPSAKNLQPWHFVVFTDNQELRKIASCYNNVWLKQAPVIIVACGDHNSSWRRSDGKDHCDIDVAIAVDHLTLAATNFGLSTCWICKFNVMQCSDILMLPDGIEPVALIPLGYPAEEADTNRHQKLRKSFNKIVHWNTF
ncbi:MAG: nitroreductase family protein [Bacteroidales bacterium]|nr:nitroreductase family protein [Bacteroidales bacterium]